MFLFKRKPSLSEYDTKELKNFVGKTIEIMLLTKEETIHVSKKYDLVLLFSWEGEYIEGNLYKLSTFNLAKNGLSSLINTPLYTETRYFEKTDDGIKYIDDEKIKDLSTQNLFAFYTICELITLVEIEVISPKRYMCIWK